uniref:LY6/PLAUR domain containing 6 n=1 Tax=Astyanax mexicanus TaxID=7994 RepID=A0A3B1KEA0_ASTMX
MRYFRYLGESPCSDLLHMSIVKFYINTIFKCIGCHYFNELYHSFVLAESKYCYTSHKLDWSGNTLSVTKSCAALEDCVATGCSELDHEGNKVCVACCEGNICNLPLPRNETDAIFATTSPLSGGQRTTLHPTMPLSFLISTLLVLSQG